MVQPATESVRVVSCAACQWEGILGRRTPTNGMILERVAFATPILQPLPEMLKEMHASTLLAERVTGGRSTDRWRKHA